MKELISKIEEVYGVEFLHAGRANTGDGFQITTDQQVIVVLISDQQSCCENWGHVASLDDFSEFIGAALRNIVTVDTALNTKVQDDTPNCDYGGDTMFVNFETDRGTFQLVLYNDHNGYYGHEAIIRSKQLTEGNVL